MRRPSSSKRNIRKPRHQNNAVSQKRIIRMLLVLGALALLVIFFFGDHGLYQLFKLRTERQEVQVAINNLRKEKQKLEEQKTRLQTDYKYIEKLAREKYRMAKRGEKVYKVIEKGKE